MSSFHQLRAALFDLDGTLIDTEAQIATAVVETLASFGYAVTEADIHRIAGRTLRDWFAEVLGMTQEKVEAVYQAYLQRSLDTYVPLVAPMPHAEQLLDALHERGVPMAIVTTREIEVARKLLGALGWSDRFALVVGQRTARQSKPAPDPAEFSLRALRVAAEQAVMVGNTEADIACGAAAGVPVLIGVLGERTAEVLLAAGATYVCKDLAEVRALLDQ